MIMPGGEVVDYTYDAVGRLNQIASFLGEFDFSYDALGRRTGLTYPNGVETSYNYDAVGRLTGILAQVQGRKGKSDIINAFTYTHDAVGNRLSKTVATGRHDHTSIRFDYAYDAVYQLLESLPVEVKRHGEKAGEKQAEAFSYDPVGNRLSGPDWKDRYLTTPSTRCLKAASRTYQYDANGNLIAKTGLDEDQAAWSYEYDYENRLTRATRVEEDEIKTITFKYDPFGRRIEKRVEEIEEDGVECTTNPLSCLKKSQPPRW